MISYSTLFFWIQFSHLTKITFNGIKIDFFSFFIYEKQQFFIQYLFPAQTQSEFRKVLKKDRKFKLSL